MISDDEYDRLYDRQPKTLKGRVWLAGFLIRNGRAGSRLYDCCFENGDGGLVIAHLMQKIRADSPELRALMQEQGAWSADYDAISDRRWCALCPTISLKATSRSQSASIRIALT